MSHDHEGVTCEMFVNARSRARRSQMRDWLVFTLALSGGLVIAVALVLDISLKLAPEVISGETKDRLTWFRLCLWSVTSEDAFL
jgi:hypothetical protein